jgi:acetone carboxylase gamma subunit
MPDVYQVCSVEVMCYRTASVSYRGLGRVCCSLVYTDFTSKYYVKASITVAQKAQQFHRIYPHLMMAEYTDTESVAKNFKEYFILNLDIFLFWTVNKTETSSAKTKLLSNLADTDYQLKHDY